MPSNVTFNRIPEDARARWQTVRDVISGDQAMRSGPYLPRLNASDMSADNDARNAAYVARAVFYNATGRTLDGLIGLAFKKDPISDMPVQLDYLLKDADARKNSIYQQSQSVLANVLAVGRHGLYVDFDAQARPVIKSYAADSVINWRYDDGALALVVLEESAEEVDESGFGIAYVTQWRELALENGQCVCRVWRKNKEGEPEVVPLLDANGNTVTQVAVRSQRSVLDFIPFQFVGSRNNDCDIDSSPLYDLARLNVAHFRNSADYEDSVFYTGQAQPWLSGADDNWVESAKKEKFYIGSRNLLWVPQGGAFGFAQPLPNTLVKEAMEQKEAQMIALGARLIDQAAIAVTATQNENDREASTSVLSMCVSNVNEAYQSVIRWCALLQGAPITDDDAAAAYKIRQDFSRTRIDSQAVAALVGAWQSGAIGLVDLRAYMRAEGIIATERSDDEIDGDLEAQGPALGDMVDNTAPMDTGNNAMSAMQAQDASPPVAAPFDATALIAAIAALGDKLQTQPAQDLTALIEAISTREPVTLEASIDTAPIAQAMKEEWAVHGTIESTPVQPVDLKPLQDQLAALSAQVAAIPTKAPEQPVPQPAPDPVNLTPLTAQIAALAAQVTALQNEPAVDTAQIVADSVKPLQDQIAALTLVQQHKPQPVVMIDPAGNVTRQIQINRDADGNITGASVAPQQ